MIDWEDDSMASTTACYIRISTGMQSLAQQKAQVLAAVQKGHGKPLVYEEVGSGVDDKRPYYNELKSLISRGKLKTLYVWSLDRLGRNGREIREFVELCIERKVTLISVKEKFDLDSPFAPIVIAVISTMAEMEWERISERTKAKLDYYKSEYGWRSHGQPPATANILAEKVIKHVPKILDAHKAGLSIRQIAAAFSVTTKTVMKIVNRPNVKWRTRQEWVKENPNWYKTPQDFGAPDSARAKMKKAMAEG